MANECSVKRLLPHADRFLSFRSFCLTQTDFYRSFCLMQTDFYHFAHFLVFLPALAGEKVKVS